MAKYASKLTKKELIEGGITNITADGRVFKNEIELIDLPLNPSGYKYFNIYDRDENGCCIKRYYPTRPGYFTYKCKAISLQRAMWAWFNEEVPEGYVVDHINANKNDYRLDNLQLLTPKANINKEKINWHTREIKCQMTKPRSFYEEKLMHYEKEYEQAKQESNAKECHKLRSNISQLRARLRYWDSHADEYTQYEAQKQALETRKKEHKQNVQDIKFLSQYKEIFKSNGNIKMWKQMIKVIKNWKTYNSIQKEHIFKVLSKHF